MVIDLHLNSSVGVAFIGVMLAVMLNGFSIAQTMYYYLNYPDDGKALKGFVAFLWILDTVRTAFDLKPLKYLWFIVVAGHADIAIIESFSKCQLYNDVIFRRYNLEVHSTKALSVSGSVITDSILLDIVCWWTCICVGVVCRDPLNLHILSKCTYITSTRGSDATQALLNAKYTACTQTISATVADVYIAIAMSLILHKKRTGWARTESLLTKLVVIAVHRGILAAIIQLGHFILFVSTLQDLPYDLYFSLFHYPGTKSGHPASGIRS
ncbi:hypothetical protein WOLCODRAFT_144245 [Wolfiporia cocos MD-104 SS10]|uniref:DUF6534 domain-containing protein n=1 Tax=Wolfiporia cocos (strain MD-104) TaxID=742152 RepID=A0A2H3JLU7_WOLCO|nr:hypothetical protein WOLCODRAFT_144245 [Wolfiporia cocos MD-104 SS10]